MKESENAYMSGVDTGINDVNVRTRTSNRVESVGEVECSWVLVGETLGLGDTAEAPGSVSSR